MKIDKDFAVKVEGKVFTANEISSVSFDIAWFRMECISDNGTKFTVEASLKDVEFLNIARESKIEVDETRLWNIWNGEHVSKKINCSFEDIKEVLSEAIETLKEEQHCDIKLEINGEQFAKIIKKCNHEPEPKTATESLRTDRERLLFCPFGIRKEYTGKAHCKVGDEPKSDFEMVTPLPEIKKKSVEEMIASMKAAGELIKKSMEAISKADETIKIDCSIDREQLSKLINAHSEAITRSGG